MFAPTGNRAQQPEAFEAELWRRAPGSWSLHYLDRQVKVYECFHTCLLVNIWTFGRMRPAFVVTFHLVARLLERVGMDHFLPLIKVHIFFYQETLLVRTHAQCQVALLAGK